MIADQHPDVERLDAYAEGSADADGNGSSSGVALHIGACPQCRETVTALRRVRRELAALASVTMPEDVAERLRATLVSERNGRLPGSRDSAAGQPAPSGSWRPGRHPGRIHGRLSSRPNGGPRLGRPTRIPAWFTAATCLIIVVGMVGLMVALARQPGQSVASASGGELPAPLTAPLPARAPASDAGDRSAGEAASSPVSDAAGPAILAHTGHPVSMAEIPQHALDLVTGRIPGTLRAPLREYDAATAGPSTAVAAVITELTRPDLRLCYLSLATQIGGSIAALDLVTFNGQPAVLVVLSVPTAADQLRVIVLDERCSVANLAAALWYSTTASQ
ncbi:anti-sigma factor [Frankia sp. CiP3]|uniref:anti-sigma factor family protein n=1 Tax=Frankia sp. CiP3 TaxID=2880971 RepID=UPI001EF534C5|nr:hypothetical protein [Frankia sp. CiP3]